MCQIIDIISFNGEIILELRIKYLFNFVDKFYIIESAYTHSGIKKDTLFCNSDYWTNILKPYILKIEFIIIDNFPNIDNEWLNTKLNKYMTQGSYDSWYREHYQRNYIFTNENIKISTPYIALICDVDEIPNTDVIFALKNNYDILNDKIFYFEMNFYYYNFNWLKKEKWYYAYAINNKFIEKNGYDLTHYRTVYPKQYILNNAGWHCSYFLSWKDIIRKLESFAHREFDNNDIKNFDYLYTCFTNGTDLFQRGQNENMIFNDLSLINNQLFIDFHNKLNELQRKENIEVI